MPPLYEGRYATGALPRPPDMRDWRLEREPRVAAQLAAGLPERFMILPLEQYPSSLKIDQGMIPKCVASSDCQDRTVQQFMDLGVWEAFDDDELYRACGGNGTNGIYTQTSLEYLKNVGALQRSDFRRRKIESYLFAPQVYGEFRRTISASLMATGGCVGALMLPAGLGWESSDSPTDLYHQMKYWGWDGLGDDDWSIWLNSWGENGPGRLGFVRIRWRYLESGNFQNQLCYAFTMRDVREGTQPPPPPPPKPRYFVTGWVVGESPEPILVGGTYSLTLKVSDVRKETTPDPPPPPPPPPPTGELTITGGVARITGGRVVLTLVVHAGGVPTAAYIDVEGHGQAIYGGKRPTTKVLGVVPPGTELVLSAREAQGKRTGRLIVTV